jgi:thiamine transport system substrate-binding protein
VTANRIAAVAVTCSIIVAACGGDTTDKPEAIVLLTHDSFAVSDGILEQFETDTGVAVQVLRAGDAGTMVSQAVLTKDSPIADVIYGVDNTFLSRALAADIFLPYVASDSDKLIGGLAADERVTPIDFGDVCLNYDKAALAAADLAVPTNLHDLIDESYRAQLVVENPATSSPGLAFLMATIASFPQDAAYSWRDYWADLRDNDVLVVRDWNTAYYSEFAGGGSGTRSLVVSYASSPPAGVVFSDPPPDVAPTGVVLPGCFRQVEYAGVLAGTGAEPWARQFIDFMLSPTFQEDMPLNMFVFPARADIALPAAFLEHTEVPPAPATLAPEVIDADRERWIEEWTEIMRS